MKKTVCAVVITALLCQPFSAVVYGASDETITNVSLSFEDGGVYNFPPIEETGPQSVEMDISLSYTTAKELNYIKFVTEVTKDGEPVESTNIEVVNHSDPLKDWLSADGAEITVSNPDKKIPMGTHKHRLKLSGITAAENSQYDVKITGLEYEIPGYSEIVKLPAGDITYSIGNSSSSKFAITVTNRSSTKDYSFRGFELRNYLLLNINPGETIDAAVNRLNASIGGGNNANGGNVTVGDKGWMTNAKWKITIIPLSYPIVEDGVVVSNAYMLIEFNDNTGSGQYVKKNSSETIVFSFPADMPFVAGCDGLYFDGVLLGIDSEYIDVAPEEIIASDMQGMITARVIFAPLARPEILDLNALTGGNVLPKGSVLIKYEFEIQDTPCDRIELSFSSDISTMSYKLYSVYRDGEKTEDYSKSNERYPDRSVITISDQDSGFIGRYSVVMLVSVGTGLKEVGSNGIIRANLTASVGSEGESGYYSTSEFYPEVTLTVAALRNVI